MLNLLIGIPLDNVDILYKKRYGIPAEKLLELPRVALGDINLLRKID